MKIFVLSAVYPARYSPKGTTPVVHYFAKEWVALGHEVHVFHTASCFPTLYYILGRPFKKLLDSKLGHLIPTNAPEEYDEVRDGVKISHINIKKGKPHAKFSHTKIYRTFEAICMRVEEEGVPDCFVGHWDNPQLELLNLLKEKFKKPVCLVYHCNEFSYLSKLYGSRTELLVNGIDLVGFRNITAQLNYESLFGKPKHSFICASGVSRQFVEAGRHYTHPFGTVHKFTFVGGLISRKHPVAVIEALALSYKDEPFKITYIGDGNEKEHIQNVFDECHCAGNLTFTGLIPRDEIIGFLKQTDVFVMISKGEIFGLVYLEAMALGCITIASRNEGIDGIIEDGVNGFLCDAGDANELVSIVDKIRKMQPEELTEMSNKAKKTAQEYSDVNVAIKYINELEKLEV